MEKDNTLTVGMDIGDRYSEICIVDEEEGKVVVVETSRVKTTKETITRYLQGRQPMLVAMEVGTHSPWVSEVIRDLGHEIIVANARKLKFIYGNENKNDMVDAEALARVARADRELLYPIAHRPSVDAETMALIRSRDALVRSRAMLVNHVRGMMKSCGERLKSGVSTQSFHKHAGDIPERIQPALDPVMKTIEEISRQIKVHDREIVQVSRKRYPETALLQEISGVGPITALAFILVVSDIERFKKNRSIGAYLGLTPRRDQSGDRDPELSISKRGNPYLRRLLVSAAHYILGPFGPDCDLKRYGVRIAARGGKRAKRRAAIAVARKLSVLMLSLLRSGENYEPLRQNLKRKEKAA
jgi:transposase